jgi:hypothetical protein
VSARSLRHQLGRLADIETLDVAVLEALQRGWEKPSVKQHLAAIQVFEFICSGIESMDKIDGSRQSILLLGRTR